MCGITVFLVASGQQEAVRQHLSANLLTHRGPDGSTVEFYDFDGPPLTHEELSPAPSSNNIYDHFAMGFDRLAIVNLDASGMQPFESDGRAMVATGEVYNYKELLLGCESALPTRSDMEVILLCSDKTNKKGIVETLSCLDGDYAFVVVDRAQRTVFAARDHVGVRPLFYALDASGMPFAFASEAKALHGAPGVARVEVFPPGTYLSMDLTAVSDLKSDFKSDFEPYVPWTSNARGLLQRARGGGDPFEEVREAERGVRELLTEAVKKRLEHSDRPVGVLCSGGVDSAILLALAMQNFPPERLRVFTMEYAGSRSEDAFYAKMLCERLFRSTGRGPTHQVVSFDREDVARTIEKVIRACETYDPNTIRAAIPMYLLAEHIAKETDVKVILSGEGADELFGGYNYFRFATSDAQLNEETARLLRNMHMFDLLRADRCFAAHGLEVRVPFLDQSLVSFVRDSVTGKHKRNEKELLRKAFLCPDMDLLKELRIIDRPKERFSDGCGFSYVPQLLNHVSESAKTLPEKLAREKQHYMEAFERSYGSANAHWIAARVLPDGWMPGHSSTAASSEALELF